MPPSFDEMRISASEVRDHYRTYERWLQAQPQEVMRDPSVLDAERHFYGRTYAVDPEPPPPDPLTAEEAAGVVQCVYAGEWREGEERKRRRKEER